MSVPITLTKSLAHPDPAHIPLSQKIIALCGDSKSTHSLILQSLCIRAARGEHLALVVGDNHFDVYRLARLSRAHGFDPAALLSCIELSRPLTCYQLQHRVLSLCAQNQDAYDALYVIGLLETFYDEDVKESEAVRLLIQILTHLKIVAADGLPILLSMALPKLGGRAHLMELVKHAVHAYWQPSPIVFDQVNAQQLAFTEMF